MQVLARVGCQALHGVCLALLAVMLANPQARAAEALVAVAANFAGPAEALEAAFEASGPHRATITTGSTGKLYAQISNGAPFDVLLAADQVRPERLEAEGDAVAGTRFTFAIGRLSLWSADPDRIAGGLDALRAGDFDHLAIANPDLAPYGLAARQALQYFGLWDTLKPKIVMGQNVGQTFSLVATGNAALGLIATPLCRSVSAGSRWDVPEQAHDPIRQDAVLLARGADNPAARAFLAFLRSDAAKLIISRFGYATE